MVGKKSPVKNTMGGKKIPMIANRPRRFSLIYSSDSSLSDVSDDEKIFKNKNKKGRKSFDNSYGKTSKLIQQRSGKNQSDDESTESSDYEAIGNNKKDSSDDDEDDDDDDDDNDDSDSETSSSDDENIDFVKLTAQRKKKTMQAFAALKRGKITSDVTTEKEQKQRENKNQLDTSVSKQPKESTNITKPNVLLPTKAIINKTNKKNSTKNLNKATSTKTTSDEDIGVEISDLKDNSITNNIRNIEENVGPLHAPTFSESEESDYDFDQDTYFTAINNDDDSVGEIDTGLETAEDDLPILESEEQNIVNELENDYNLSFEGSVQEEGSDPAENLDSQFIANKYNEVEDDYDDEEDDEEVISDFDMSFYEDPKFSNLYYYEDGREPKLSLSASLPLILNEEKKNRMQKREAKIRERQERIRARKLLRKSARTNKSLSIDGDEYSFGAFFHSDNEDEIDPKDNSSQNKSSNEGTHNSQRKDSLFDNSGYNSSDSEYDNILLDIAHIPTDEESIASHGLKSTTSNNEKSHESLELDSDMDIDDYDDDSMTNVFIDIDDLDPDSFYFHYSDDDSSTNTHYSSGNNTPDKYKDDLQETVVYVDNESTDEDDNIPPPTLRKQNIGKEIVSSNTVGLRPPKLGTWETDSKPFSIIDGLSTKSLYTLIQEHQQLHDQQSQRTHSTNTKETKLKTTSEGNSPTGEEITLNELLNMSDMDEGDEENTTNNYNSLGTSDWYNKPKVPLSAFRNKGVDLHEDDEYILPSLNTKKVPIGYVGGERTRKKIDKMKEFQRKRTEKKRILKKKRKLLKIKREHARAEKEKSLLGSNQSLDSSHLVNTAADFKLDLLDHDPIADDELIDDISRKNSVTSVGIDEIYEILGKNDSNLIDDSHDPLAYTNKLDHTGDLMDDSDANIIASLTAPLEFDDYGNGSSTLWKQRRQSMVEAAGENLRFTKNGLFSESALADIEGILNSGGPSNALEFNEVLQ